MIDLIKAKREQIDSYLEQLREKNDTIEKYFDGQREKYQEMLEPLYTKLGKREMETTITLQAEVLSLRGKIQEDITNHMNRLSKENTKYKKSVADRMEYYMHGFGYKTASTERKELINRDIAERKRMSELLESHIEYLREIRYSCDQIQFAVKNLVGIMNYI